MWIKSVIGLAVWSAAMVGFPARPAFAASTCLTIEAPLDRLACYDKEMGRTPASNIEPTRTEWTSETKVSKLTDDKGIYLYLRSKDPVICRWKQGQQAFLTIRCHEKTTAIILSTECHMTSSPYHDWGKVEYRVDDKPAKSVRMDESTDNTALGLWRGAQAIPMIKQLLGGKNVIMRYVPYNEAPITSEFHIEGLDEVIKPLREECKW